MGLLAVPGVPDAFSIAAVRRRRLPARQWLVAEAILVVVALAAAAATDHDFAASVGDVARSAAARLRDAPWELTPVLLVLAGLHYAASAVALRTAAGLPLPLRQSFKVQLAAAAANRVTPAGLGAAAVNARYLMRNDRDSTQVISVLSALGLLGAVADAIVFALVIVVGSWFGMHGAAHELGALAHKLTGPVAGAWNLLGWSGVLATAVGLLSIAAGILTYRRRRPGADDPAATGFGAAKVIAFVRRLSHDLRVQFAGLLRAPARLAVLLFCSAATTLTLAVGFMLTAQFASHGTTIGAGGLVVAYMLGGMAGSVAPGPAGAGATEAALAGILISGGMPAAVAISSVVFYRLVTFWAPPLAGVWALRGLRREAAI